VILSEKWLKKIFLPGGLLIYLLFLLVYVNLSYPWIGHDYRYFLPRLLDTRVHYLNNGFTVQWFTPSFGGGLPAYFHPQHLQFSLQQLFTYWLHPWVATLLTVCIYTAVGYGMFYLFLREVMDVNWQAGILGALFFISTGFFIQHSTTGTAYEGYPLIALILFVLYSTRISNLQGGILIGIVLALWIFSAGFYLFVVLGLVIIMMIPLIYLLHPGRVQGGKLFMKALLSVVVFTLLSIGKIYAVFSFMQNFPREIDNHYYSTFFAALVGTIVQLIGVPLFTVPLRVLRNPSAVGQMMTALVGGQQLGIWEMDISISPVLLYILFFQIRKIPAKIREGMTKKTLALRLNREKKLAFIFLIFAGWIAFSFTSARGWIFDMMHNLPVLKSLHNNPRFAVAFVLPLSILGAKFFDLELLKLVAIKRNRTFVFFFLATLASLGIYFLLPLDLQSRNYNYRTTLEDYQSAKDNEKYYVEKILVIPDMYVFENHASSFYPYEPIFGYENEEFSARLVPGSIYLEEDGYYNMTNPRSLVYDSEELFARFITEEREKLEQFAHYQQLDWDIPPMQHFLNTVSAVTFVGVSGYGLVRLGIWVSGLLKLKRANESSGG
jgi:hypothetical protein